MGFWMSTLSTSIGAFIGVLGAYIIAKWQMGKAHKMNNMPFYIQFNEAQININRFNEKVDKILNYTQTAERKYARIHLSHVEFNELKEEITNTIKTLNPEFESVDFKNFHVDLGKIAKNAPLGYYTDISWLILSMVLIHDLLLKECKNILMYPPEPLDYRNFHYMNQTSYLKIIKSHRKKYKMLKKKMNIRK
ncbi:hypothetical protein [Neobacillus mesonae]|uniref:DUF4760 domain-containing protein n=1 Tax=Neobacillus mesonae TaxID=1193713 RepID=A0A3T0HSU0_9BACI|nr:hypothetical protein [Neobacillus mesonae]AZU60111.1 hypothetical protein CHR53_01860 [Neobacillus mesonae]